MNEASVYHDPPAPVALGGQRRYAFSFARAEPK